MMKTWSLLGYDTAWVPKGLGVTPSGLEEDCVYDPARIKVVRRVRIKEVNANSSSKSPSLRGLFGQQPDSPPASKSNATKSPLQNL